MSKFTFQCYIFNQQTEPGLHKWSEIQKYTLEIQEIRPNTAWGACLNRFQSSITFEPDVGFDFPKRQNLLELDFPTDGNIIWLARAMLEEGGLIYCCNIGNRSLWEAKTILNGPKTGLGHIFDNERLDFWPKSTLGMQTICSYKISGL